MRRERVEVLLAHAAQGGGIALARSLARPAVDFEEFQPVGVPLHTQGTVAVPGFDIVVPQGGILQDVAVGIDGAWVLETMDGGGIEDRSHRNSPAMKRLTETLGQLSAPANCRAV